MATANISVVRDYPRDLPITGVFHLLERGRGGIRQPNPLAHLNDEDLETVLNRARRCRIRPKQLLFRQGDRHRGIYIIQSGVVRTYYTSPAGREITLAYWQPGNFVGGPDVFEDCIHMWSGIAVRDTEVYHLRGPDLRELMAQIPDLALGMVEALVYKGRCFSSLVQLLGTRSVSGRLSQVLLALCDNYGVPEGNGVAIDVHLTHEDLAHMVGASRQWVTTTLDRLQKKDIVRIRKRKLVILRPDLLRAQEAHEAHEPSAA
jgi:CRP-like cAMP-binding protein